jgi:hypothetical protein
MMRPSLMSASMMYGALAAMLGVAGTTLAQQKIHYTYLWHLEQPVYWPERQASGADRYERAWETIQRLDAGGTRPQDNLRAIFGLDDRVAAYQWRVRDSINSIRWTPEGGAQISYSGGLIENVMSLGAANQLGYSPNWMNPKREARQWLTNTPSNNRPRLDIVQFSFHHALLPLLEDSTIRKELQLYRRIYGDAWGNTPAQQSRGLFPSEMAFSMRLIPILASEGIGWSIVSAEKISRAQVGYPVIYGSGGINCEAPNRADQLNPSSSFYYRRQIDRGVSPAESPFSLVPRRAKYIDPNTGAASEIIVIPASQSISWRDGYAPLGLSDFDALQPYNDPNRPMLITLAHDGDNAWGGGFSYYMEAVNNLASQATANQYVPTVIEKYLADHPVPANDYVHVEQGAWVNADGDFGAPQFINWNWPPVNAQGRIDIENGWAEDIRNWSVITAAQNRVDTAEQIWRATPGNSVDIGQILYPGSATNNVERAWHYFLGGLNSGFMYYGTALDMENKPVVTSNRAMLYADAVIGNANADQTGPTIWIPQRHPWNPGDVNFGPHWGYQQRKSDGDFYVWTFAYDVSGLGSVTLKYRLDADGQNPLGSTENETYAGGPGVGTWQSVAMTSRAFPMGNFFNDANINYYVMPTYSAPQYFARINGVRSALVDYYIEATDSKGNIKRSPIQHVWVGDGVGGVGPGPGGGSGGGPTGPTVAIAPAAPVAGQPLTITYSPTGRPLEGASSVNLYWGINTWTNIVASQPLSLLTTGPDAGKWQTTITLPSSATSLQFVFNNGPTNPSIWDNNGGADWRYTVSGGTTPPPVPTWTIDGTRDSDSTLLGSVGGANLWAGVKGDVLYLATDVPTGGAGGRDRFLLMAREANALRPAMWAKGGQVAGWDAFVGAESSNAFAGWFDAGSGVATQVARGTTGTSPVLEATINLRQEWSIAAGQPLPAAVRVALGVYENPDGGALVTAQQPTPSGAAIAGNANIEATEYFLLPIVPPVVPCTPSDVAGANQSAGPDGQLTADDIIVFLGWYFAEDARADIAGPNQSPTPDGQRTADDIIVFLGRYFAGC